MDALVGLVSCHGGLQDACTSMQNITTRSLIDEKTQTVVELTLEVDYESCTTLYKKIEEQDWESVVHFLETGYWIGALFADPVPATDQARTWVTRFDPDSATKIKWSQLPLHLAVVVDAPLGVIRRLVEAYPKALKCTDDEHMLPFHLAMRHGAPDDVMDYLLSSFPDAVNVKAKHGRSAMDCALRSRKKARARFLQVFLEKSRDKEATDLWNVKTELDEKNEHLIHLQEQLSALDTAKTMVEDELAGKITELLDTKAALEQQLDDLRQEKQSVEMSAAKFAGHLQHTNLYQQAETDRKIAKLEAHKKELEAAEQQIQDDEARLHSNLAVIERRVGVSFDRNDMDALKNDVSCFQAFRLEHTRSRAT
jgi:hypothetical protein